MVSGYESLSLWKVTGPFNLSSQEVPTLPCKETHEFHVALIIYAMGEVPVPFPEHENSDYLLNNSFSGKTVIRLKEKIIGY